MHAQWGLIVKVRARPYAARGACDWGRARKFKTDATVNLVVVITIRQRRTLQTTASGVSVLRHDQSREHQQTTINNDGQRVGVGHD